MRWTRALFILEAWRELRLYDRRFARGGFPGVYRHLKQQLVAKRQRDTSLVPAICEAVDIAACFHHKGVRCLQRAVVTVILLRRHGIAANFVIVYRSSPFLAHAYAEVDGRIVNDKAGYADRLNLLHRQQGEEAKGGSRR
jgi:hypothetical protein